MRFFLLVVVYLIFGILLTFNLFSDYPAEQLDNEMGSEKLTTIPMKEVIFLDVFIYILTLETYCGDDSVTA